MTDQEPQAERPIESTDNKPCGCVMITYEDGGQLYTPCVPHGLFGVAQNLEQAARAMGAVATVLQKEQMQAMQRGNIVDAIQKAQADTAAQDAADAEGAN